MPAAMSVRESHDIALQLQHRVRMMWHPPFEEQHPSLKGGLLLQVAVLATPLNIFKGCARWRDLMRWRELLCTSTTSGELSQSTRSLLHTNCPMCIFAMTLNMPAERKGKSWWQAIEGLCAVCMQVDRNLQRNTMNLFEPHESCTLHGSGSGGALPSPRNSALEEKLSK